MRPIKDKFRKIIDTDPYYKKCLRENSECSGRITIEHAWIYSGRQIDDLWNLLPLCEYHHLGDGIDKDFNRWVALHRATQEDLAKYPKRNWQQELRWLNSKYGTNPPQNKPII